MLEKVIHGLMETSLRFAPALSVFSFLVLFLLGRDSHAYLSLVSWTLVVRAWLQLLISYILLIISQGQYIGYHKIPSINIMLEDTWKILFLKACPPDQSYGSLVFFLRHYSSVTKNRKKETEIESRLFERNQRNPKTESRDHKEKERPLPSDP